MGSLYYLKHLKLHLASISLASSFSLIVSWSTVVQGNRSFSVNLSDSKCQLFPPSPPHCQVWCQVHVSFVWCHLVSCFQSVVNHQVVLWESAALCWNITVWRTPLNQTLTSTSGYCCFVYYIQFLGVWNSFIFCNGWDQSLDRSLHGVL